MSERYRDFSRAVRFSGSVGVSNEASRFEGGDTLSVEDSDSSFLFRVTGEDGGLSCQVLPSLFSQSGW